MVQSYEWYAEFNDLQDIIKKYVNKENNGNILVIGCGDSALCEELGLYIFLI